MSTARVPLLPNRYPQGMDAAEHGSHAYNLFAGDWDSLQVKSQDNDMSLMGSLRKRSQAPSEAHMGNRQVALPLEDEDTPL